MEAKWLRSVESKKTKRIRRWLRNNLNLTISIRKKETGFSKRNHLYFSLPQEKRQDFPVFLSKITVKKRLK
jgi:hypothetical protein